LSKDSSNGTLLHSPSSNFSKDTQRSSSSGVKKAFCACFGICQSRTQDASSERRKQKEDSYKVSIIIGRPENSSYAFDLFVMIVLVLLAITSFWDTAAPELSSRMSISLTIILTLAAYTSTRPPPIVKCPKLTFQDRYEVCSFLMVTGVSIMNLFSVSMCGGEHPEAPGYMKQIYEQQPEWLCDRGWCASRAIDCHFMIIFLSGFVLVTICMFYRVFQERMRLSPAVREADEDERSRQLELRKQMNSGRRSPDPKDQSMNSTYGRGRPSMIGRVAPERLESPGKDRTPGRSSSKDRTLGQDCAQTMPAGWPGGGPPLTINADASDASEAWSRPRHSP